MFVDLHIVRESESSGPYADYLLAVAWEFSCLRTASSWMSERVHRGTVSVVKRELFKGYVYGCFELNWNCAVCR